MKLHSDSRESTYRYSDCAEAVSNFMRLNPKEDQLERTKLLGCSTLRCCVTSHYIAIAFYDQSPVFRPYDILMGEYGVRATTLHSTQYSVFLRNTSKAREDLSTWVEEPRRLKSSLTY